jgi:uncharacterized protein YutE (UPF0331/DUF86 family)
VDIGLHIISYLDGPVPESMAETFLFLQKAGYLSEEVAGRMVKAVGFRNTAVHAYQSIDWNIVFRIGTLHLTDFQDFARQILARLD